jgi:hypothetical protein
MFASQTEIINFPRERANSKVALGGGCCFGEEKGAPGAKDMHSQRVSWQLPACGESGEAWSWLAGSFCRAWAAIN